MDCTLKTIFADLTFTLELVMKIAKYKVSALLYIYVYLHVYNI